MKKLFILAIIASLGLASCTENERAKRFGGTATINLPTGQKLVNVTWKDTQLWYLTRQMKPNDSAETYEFKEESSFGIIEGTVKLVETK